jgi:hypothetical protein
MIDWEQILFLFRLVRRFGSSAVRTEVNKLLTEKESITGRNYSFEKDELDRLIREL